MANTVLWRYRPYIPNDPDRKNELQQIVQDGRMWAPSANKFNDPFECQPVFNASEIPVEEQIRRTMRMVQMYAHTRCQAQAALKRARSGYMNSESFRREMKERLLNELKRTPILCFYPTWNSLRMWAHYGGDLQGYAVGVRMGEGWDDHYCPLPVNYTSSRPKIDLSEDILGDSDKSRRFAKQVFLTKSSVWADEQESRSVLHGKKEGFFDFNPGCVIEVCFGLNASTELVSVGRHLQAKCNKDLVLSQVQLSNSDFSLEKVPI